MFIIISKLDVTAAIRHHHSVGICLQYMVEKPTLWCFLSHDAYFKEEIDFFFYQWFSVVDYLASYFTTAILKYINSIHAYIQPQHAIYSQVYLHSLLT